MPAEGWSPPHSLPQGEGRKFFSPSIPAPGDLSRWGSVAPVPPLLLSSPSGCRGEGPWSWVGARTQLGGGDHLRPQRHLPEGQAGPSIRGCLGAGRGCRTAPRSPLGFAVMGNAAAAVRLTGAALGLAAVGRYMGALKSQGRVRTRDVVVEDVTRRGREAGVHGLVGFERTKGQRSDPRAANPLQVSVALCQECPG